MLKTASLIPSNTLDMLMPCISLPIEAGCKIKILNPVMIEHENGEGQLVLKCHIVWPASMKEDRLLPLTFFCKGVRGVDGKLITAKGSVPDFIRNMRPSYYEFYHEIRSMVVIDVHNVMAEMPNGKIINNVVCDLDIIE